MVRDESKGMTLPKTRIKIVMDGNKLTVYYPQVKRWFGWGYLYRWCAGGDWGVKVKRVGDTFAEAQSIIDDFRNSLIIDARAAKQNVLYVPYPDPHTS